MSAIKPLSRRIDLLQKELSKRKLDAMLVTTPANVTYLTGFAAHDSSLLVTAKKIFFITDSRYAEEAENTLEGLTVIVVSTSTYASLEEIVKRHRLSRIGFESTNLPYEVASRLKRLLAGSRLVPLQNAIERFRAVKDEDEVRAIRRAVRLTKEVFGRAARTVRPGVTEAAVGASVEIDFLRHGARVAFDPIVAAGANASKPHARPREEAIRDDSFVMIDLGCVLNGYNADLTRMIIVGKAHARFLKIYDIVRIAQERALEKIRPGALMRDIDAAARNYIGDKGYGTCFGHSLGHGVGIDVHEAPSISPTSEGRVAEGMVFTVEPAIYIPKFGGVRIEDMVLVTGSGYELLTR